METARTKLTAAEKIARLREGYAAFNRGDINTVLDLQTDDCVWRGRGSTKYRGDFKGKAGIVRMLSQIPQDFEEFKLDVHDILSNDEHAAVLVTSRRKGKTYEDNAVHVHHINDEGKTMDLWLVSDTELDERGPRELGLAPGRQKLWRSQSLYSRGRLQALWVRHAHRPEDLRHVRRPPG
jgi:ketosteroid isomerase-like protein